MLVTLYWTSLTNKTYLKADCHFLIFLYHSSANKHECALQLENLILGMHKHAFCHKEFRSNGNPPLFKAVFPNHCSGYHKRSQKILSQKAAVQRQLHDKGMQLTCYISSVGAALNWPLSFNYFRRKPSPVVYFDQLWGERSTPKLVKIHNNHHSRNTVWDRGIHMQIYGVCNMKLIKNLISMFQNITIKNFGDQIIPCFLEVAKLYLDW